MKLLVAIFNHRAYLFFAACALIASLFLILSDTVVTALEIGAVTGLLVLLLVIWGILVTRQTPGMDSVAELRQRLQNGRRPTVVQLYSPYCVGCLAVKPVLDQLEQEAAGRLQVIRLNIEEEPGKTLVQEHNVLYTPTFLYFDAQGAKLRESTFILDRERILRDLSRPLR